MVSIVAGGVAVIVGGGGGGGVVGGVVAHRVGHLQPSRRQNCRQFREKVHFFLHAWLLL